MSKMGMGGKGGGKGQPGFGKKTTGFSGKVGKGKRGGSMKGMTGTCK